MEITVTGRRTRIPKRLRNHIEEKLEKVTQLNPRVRHCDVVLTYEPNPRQTKRAYRVEITCHAQANVMRAESYADEEYAALDVAVNRLSQRLRRDHDRRTGKDRRTVRTMSASEYTDLSAEALAATFQDPQQKSAKQVAPSAAAQAIAAAEAAQEKAEAAAMAAETIAAAAAHDDTPADKARTVLTLREKVHDSYPMTVDEALGAMELVGHDFFLFHDKDNDVPSLVYRRHGWSYGVIRLNVLKQEQA